MSNYSESEIIERIKIGDSGAFCELVDKYKQKALNIAYSFCSNYEDARDLSQEAFIRSFGAIKRFKIKSKFYTWFYRILVNICKDYLRRKKRSNINKTSVYFKDKDGSLEPEDIFEHVASDSPGPGKSLLNKELKEKLLRAIESLPFKQKTIFTLKNMHGLKINEIAEIMRCAQGTVKAHLFKATVNLQNKLERYVNIDNTGGLR